MSGVVQQYGSPFVYLELNGHWYCYDSTSVPLGQGSVGIVYLGYDCVNRTPVAIKVLREEFCANQSVRQRVRSEAQMSFLHPNILRIFGVCEIEQDSGPMFIVSEYIQGQTIDLYCKTKLSYLNANNRTRALLLNSLSVLDAIQYVHNVGVVHRDIKPSNIMITTDATPKVMDLGIAKFEVFDSGQTKGFIGTTLYAAPELVNGAPIDGRVDIYAFGVTLYELLSGYNPFNSSTQADILSNQVNMELPENGNIDEHLLRILRLATKKDKTQRYSSARHMAYDIKEYLVSYV